MQEKLSALLDGELEDAQTGAVLTALEQDAKLRQEWQLYNLIGDVLRETGSTSTSITGRVSERLANEPCHSVMQTVTTIPEEARRARVPANRGWYSLAASVAGIAFVGWAAFQSLAPSSQPAAPTLANQSNVVKSNTNTQQVGYQTDNDANDYWVAHRQLSGHMIDSSDSDVEFVSVDQSNEGSE